MPAPYIPATDAAFQTWSLNFSTKITASPGTYGLIAADATAIAAAYSAWNSAYVTATTAATRTPVTIAAKDTQRTSSTAIFRPYAQRIANNPGVLSSDKIAVGVNPRTNSSTPIVAPVTNPVLTLDTALTLQHIIRFRDSTASPSVKAKPFGALVLQLFGVASQSNHTVVPTDQLLGTFTKSPLITTWQNGSRGVQAFYGARWVTRTGLVGPMSPTVNFTIAG